MIKLYQFPSAFGLPNASPFCMKVENYLRMVALPYQIVSAKTPLKAPKGKLPYVEDNGKRLADSTLIIEYLKATYGDKLDSWLTPEQRAIALAFQRLMEENLYWAALYTRWIEPEGLTKTKEAFFNELPSPIKWLIPLVARRSLTKELHGHGMGRHHPDEIIAIGQRDITALADFLGNKPYFMGDQPCSLDASAYAFLANIIWPPVESKLKQHAKQFPSFEAYCNRMRGRYYPS